MTEQSPDINAALALPLGTLKPGVRGVVVAVANPPGATEQDHDLERQLLEIGFVEGACVELLHQGPLGDPLAVRIDSRLTVALRRREANAVLVIPVSG